MSMISIASSGLKATQVVLNTISNNVANEQTTGYSRETVSLSSVITGGVSATSVNRETNFSLQQQNWTTNADVGYYTDYSEYSSYLEELASSDSLDVSSSLSTFYSALESASSSTSSSSLREAVLADAKSLATTFNTLSSDMDNISSEVTSEASSTVSTVNGLTSELATLNKQIVNLTAQGEDTNSLEDTRDETLTSLSSLLNVSVTQESDGSYTVSLPQGQTLVSGSTAGTLSYNSSSGLSVTYGKQTTTVSSDNLSGSLGGLLSFADNVLAPSQAALNTLAATVADQINSVQEAGYDVDGDAGTALFTYTSGNEAGTLSVASSFTADNLAFSSTSSSGSSGNNTNLLNMVSLGTSQEQSYSSLLSELGMYASSASASLSSTSSLQSTLQDSLDSISGVNSDEEAANLVTYQELYSANAKVLSSSQTLFQTLLDMF